MAGIYIHIPFCKQRCFYCDFYSTTHHSMIDDYIDAVIKEAFLRPLSNVKTVYIGGGTPSFLTSVQMNRLIGGLKKVYDFGSVEEFTVELNPDDVTHDYIMGLASNGVNRISMGVQSFVDSELSLVNRRHDSRGAINALETIKNAGITNISIDLIFGIPGQTLDSWKKSIDVAIGLSPTHISCYNLSYEEGTKLWRMRESGEVKELDESTILEMYNILINALKDAGYSHYEISNYCKPGCHSRHNSSYWDYTPYVGLGASAHSFDGNVRSYNPASVKEYIAALKIGNLPGVVEPAEWWEKYDEYIMVALRTAAGVSLNEVKRLFGDKARDYLLCNSREYLEKGLLVNDNGFLSIPEHHFMLSDAIIRDLMWDD